MKAYPFFAFVLIYSVMLQEHRKDVHKLRLSMYFPMMWVFCEIVLAVPLRCIAYPTRRRRLKFGIFLMLVSWLICGYPLYTNLATSTASTICYYILYFDIVFRLGVLCYAA